MHGIPQNTIWTDIYLILTGALYVMIGSLLGLTNTFTFSLSPTQFRVTKHETHIHLHSNENISEHTEVPKHTCLLSSGSTFLKRLMRFNKRAETVQFAPVFRCG